MKSYIKHGDHQGDEEWTTDIGPDNSLMHAQERDSKEVNVDSFHDNSNNIEASLILTMAEVKHIYAEEADKEMEERSSGVCSNILLFVKKPLEFAFMVTIPNVDSSVLDEWYSPYTITTSVLACISLLKSSVQ